jgi:hypothetical protein
MQRQTEERDNGYPPHVLLALINGLECYTVLVFDALHDIDLLLHPAAQDTGVRCEREREEAECEMVSERGSRVKT